MRKEDASSRIPHTLTPPSERKALARAARRDYPSPRQSQPEQRRGQGKDQLGQHRWLSRSLGPSQGRASRPSRARLRQSRPREMVTFCLFVSQVNQNKQLHLRPLLYSKVLAAMLKHNNSPPAQRLIYQPLQSSCVLERRALLQHCGHVAWTTRSEWISS